MEPVLVLMQDSLQAVRARRAELRESMVVLEGALAAPAPGRAAQWSERVHVALVELSADLRVHVELMEGPGGLYKEIVTVSPRLAGSADRLAVDHVALASMVDRLLLQLEQPTPDIPTIRKDGVDLLGRLVRHRQAGADLVYQGYETDIGGQD